MEERLNKYIASSGMCSRREADKLIEDGLVKVNGEVVHDFSIRVTEYDTVMVDNVKIDRIEEKVYYMINKPTGYITSTKDNEGRKTIFNLLKEVNEKVLPIGRLDFDTSGLLLLTNDKEFISLMLNPKKSFEKEYHVKVEGLLRKEESKRICKGVTLGEFKTKPCKIKNVKYNEELTSSTLDIILVEGKNREIRRLFDSENHKVKSIKRTRYGNLTLDVKEGYYRRLKPHEVKLLKLLAMGIIEK